MIDVISVEKSPTKRRLGIVVVKYYNISIYCELCMFKTESLWIRMPEIWVKNVYKQKYVWWENKQESDEFQVLVLKKVFETVGLPLDTSMKVVKDFFTSKKELTEQ